MRWRIVCLLFLIATATAGCGAHPVPRASAREMRAAERVLTADVSTLRNEWYLFKAQQELVARCMWQRRLKYFITDAGPEPDPGTLTEDAIGRGHPHTYGVVREIAALAATGAEADRGDDPTVLPQDRYVTGLPSDDQDAYVRILLGPPDSLGSLVLPSGMRANYLTEGCVGLARSRLFGSVEEALLDLMLPQDVSRSFEVVLWDDPRYEWAMSAWRRCMEEAGWKYRSPLSAIKSIRSLAIEGEPLGELLLREAAVAEADAACDSRSALRATQQTILAEYLRQQPARIIRQLADVLKARRAAVQLAVEVLMTSSGYRPPDALGSRRPRPAQAGPGRARWGCGARG